jgi:large subunit ribosomal protein L16
MKPKSTKFKKYHRPKLKNYYNYKTNLIYSNYALVTTEPSVINASQIQAITLAIKRTLKRQGKIIHRIFPHQSITKKPQEVRMGKGKGNVNQ